MVALPEWGISAIRAKVDTGARSSAIHVENLVENDDGTIGFDVVMDRKHAHLHVKVVTPYTRISKVRSSNGEPQSRYFVKTQIRIGKVTKEVEISLVKRDNMKVRMLVGRSALNQDFLVDVDSKYLTGGTSL